MKPIKFIGNSFQMLREFPKEARSNAGRQLRLIQRGETPNDFKPMPSIGKGVEEIRIWEESGTYRVFYTARLADAVYVLHAFQKKSDKTPKRDIEVAKRRLMQIVGGN